MKKIKTLLILTAFLILPTFANATSDSSGEGGKGSFTPCNGCWIGKVVGSSSFAGVRITFVDENGNAVAESGSQSFDYETYVKSSVAGFKTTYNNDSGDRNKLTMAGGGNYTAGSQRESDYKKFSAVIAKYNSYIATTGGTKSTLNTSGNTGGNQSKGMDGELQFFLSLTKKGLSSEVYSANINAFVRAIADVSGGFDADKLIYRIAEGCNKGDEIFIVMEPLFMWSGKINGVYENYTGTLADSYHFFDGDLIPHASGINVRAYIIYYEREIAAFKGATGVSKNGFTIQSGSDLLSKAGYGLAVDWANDPSIGCESCSFVDGKFVYDDKMYPGDLQIPAQFGSIEEFAFKSKDEGGAGCCDTLKSQLSTMPESWKTAYNEYCVEPTPDCCTTPVPTEPKDIEINNCCEENTISTINENLIDDLFCYDSSKKVQYFLKKCNLDENKYVDKESELNEKYCTLYCTERLSIEIPGAITAKSGKYFKLTTTSHNTTSPYVEGYRRCRVRTEYDTWRNDYKAKVQEEVDHYNDFQVNMSKYKTYEDAAKTEKTATGSITINVTCKNEYTLDNCTTNCKKSEDHSFTRTYSYSYKTYDFNTKYTAKKIALSDKTYTGITVTAGENKQYEHGTRSTYGLTDAITAANKAQSDAEAECSYNTHSSTRESMPDENKGYADEDVPTVRDKAKEAADTANKEYKTSVNEATDLEETIDQCDHYFDTTSELGKTYKGSDAKSSFKFDPDLSFYYSQVYLDDEGNLDDPRYEIEFDKECTYSVILHSEDTDSETDEDYYSETIGTGKESMKDMVSKDLDFNTSYTSYVTTTPYNADKKFSTDAKFKAVCTWKEKSKKTHTLVPSGVVSDESVTNKTVHDQEYKIYLTTLDGNYETFWDINGLGHKGSLDDYFNDGQTNAKSCANESIADSSKFTCSIHVQHEIIYTGKCDGTGEYGVTSTKESCTPTSNDYRLFNFKIVDEEDFFPSGVSTDDGDIAYNWVVDETGKEVMQEIKDKAASDTTFAPSNISYSFTLSPSDMKQIKNYNSALESENNEGYNDFNLVCDCPTEVITDSEHNGKACTKCKSVFLDNLAKGIVKYDNTDHEVTVWSGKKIDEIRSSKLKW